MQSQDISNVLEFIFKAASAISFSITLVYIIILIRSDNIFQRSAWIYTSAVLLALVIFRWSTTIFLSSVSDDLATEALLLIQPIGAALQTFVGFGLFVLAYSSRKRK